MPSNWRGANDAQFVKNMTLSLAFLAPQLVKAAVEGRLPRGINIERLRDPDADWSRQFQDLGLDPNSINRLA